MTNWINVIRSMKGKRKKPERINEYLKKHSYNDNYDPEKKIIVFEERKRGRIT